MRLSDHHFVSSAPTFGFEEDFTDPFYQPADRAATLNPHAAKALASVPFEGRAPVETMQ